MVTGKYTSNYLSNNWYEANDLICFQGETSNRPKYIGVVRSGSQADSVTAILGAMKNQWINGTDWSWSRSSCLKEVEWSTDDGQLIKVFDSEDDLDDYIDDDKYGTDWKVCFCVF